jgi:hypothetical protein
MGNHSKVGGILSIVAGGIGIFWSLFLVIIALVFLVAGVDSNSNYYGYNNNVDPAFYTFIFIIYLVWGIVTALLSILAIVGGIFALKKKIWGLALAGSIAAFFTFFLCGIPAIIFTAIGKKEFSNKVQQTPIMVNTPTAP